LIKIVDLFNLIILLNYEIWDNYLNDLSNCFIYFNLVSYKIRNVFIYKYVVHIISWESMWFSGWCMYIPR